MNFLYQASVWTNRWLLPTAQLIVLRLACLSTTPVSLAMVKKWHSSLEYALIGLEA